MKRIYLLFFIWLVNSPSFAQDANAFIKKSFVIVQSTKAYAQAKTTADKITASLKIKSDLRDLRPNKESGLTYSKKDCENEGGYPCYTSRGRYDDGNYVSIEWSDAFEGFTKGYYIVIIYSGNKTGAVATLKKVQPVFKDAYIKQASVYLGCMH